MNAQGRIRARLGIDVQPLFKQAMGQLALVEQIAAGGAPGQMVIAGGGNGQERLLLGDPGANVSRIERVEIMLVELLPKVAGGPASLGEGPES